MSEISQRDLRLRSKEIMDAVEDGQSFTVTRGGHEIGELIPLRQPRRFIPKTVFTNWSNSTPDLDASRFRADQDEAWEAYVDG